MYCVAIDNVNYLLLVYKGNMLVFNSITKIFSVRATNKIKMQQEAGLKKPTILLP